MLTFREMARWLCSARILVALTGPGLASSLPAQSNSPNTNVVELIAAEGTVEVSRAGQSVWDLASTQSPYRRLNPGDQLRTAERSRATVRLSNLTLIELGPNAHLQLLPASECQPGLGVRRGLLHLFHRDQPDQFYFRTPTASPVIRGTEFNLQVAADGTTRLDLLDGAVTLTNEFGQLDLQSGEAGMVQSGQPPRRTPALEAVNVIQWCLYYPAVLNLDELSLTAAEQSSLAESLAAYRQGDLLAALAKYPAGRGSVSAAEQLYLAALLLAVGEVAGAERELASLNQPAEHPTQLANALRTLIAAVKHQPLPSPETPGPPTPSATALLAKSYHQQSRFALEDALESARQAVGIAPDFASGWARVAELEFSFGRTRAAEAAVKRALELAPRHAQAMAVRGFLLAGKPQTAEALAQFDSAIAADSALGNAWLGRGLCRIRQGHIHEGVGDLLVAAAREPNRALLRSYLGKGFGEMNDFIRAESELLRAQQLDPRDPTAWLYSALLNQQHNRVNDAVRDLERSQALNDNRQLYRSRLLLDQDQAVRQANLAAIYQDAGLFDQSIREAARAVDSDYANSSAHTFLANSYAGRRDPGYANLRYETATLSEYLIGQLLAPVGGSALSPYVSQQEYTRLFERPGLGLSSATEYSSNGDWRQRAAQYGVFDQFDYSLDAYYETQNGERANNDLQLRQFSATTRFQLGSLDTVFVQALDTQFESGDTRQYYNPDQAERFLRIEEEQAPLVFAGWHRAWSPGDHTLLLVGRLEDNFELRNLQQFIPTITRFFGTINGQVLPSLSQFTNHQSTEFRAWSAELQQVHQTARNTMILGARYQTGRNETQIQLEHDVSQTSGPPYPLGAQEVETDLQRVSFYGYDHFELGDTLRLIGGVSYDWLDYPANIDAPPVSAEQQQQDQVSPKAGFIWQPLTNLTVRGAYTRSLGGLYFDQSVRLEPAQVAGFNQAFRSLIPESVAGIAPGAEFQTGNLEVSWQPASGTYLGVGLEWLASDATREVGLFDWQTVPPSPVLVANTPQDLDFVERSLMADVNQLIGRDWSFGIRYRVSRAELDQRMPELPDASVGQARVEDEGTLHQVALAGRYAHPCGFFAEAQALWFAQSSHNSDLPSDIPDENLWQFNISAGYRFAQRRAELRLALLNLTDEDYRLNPINLHAWVPRERTILAAFRFNF